MDYKQYHLIHPYHYNPQDQLLSNIDLYAVIDQNIGLKAPDEDDTSQLYRSFHLDNNGFILD
jgi:hypothetical protein